MKLFIFVFISLFLTSCTLGVSAPESKTGSVETSSQTGTIGVEGTGVSDPAILGTKGPISGTQAILPTPGVGTPKLPVSQPIKTEDELVKDFESEIDGLLYTIEKDAAKK